MNEVEKIDSIEHETGAIYDHLFTAYSDKLFDESVELFFKRHKMWNIDLDWFRDKVCLDAGCGGGRFVVALSRLGAKKVYGVDISKDAVRVARGRVAERGFADRTEIKNASVLEIPLEDNSVDYVVCSGVILLSPEPYKAFLELNRVLKSGGKMFLSVYGKGGLKWLANDLFRYTICKIIPFGAMEKIWQFAGVPANKRYNMLDNLYTPLTKRFTEKEIRQWFTDNGYTDLRRVKFERYDYETLGSRIVHGEGWIQIYADKIIR
ncbi:class I SAM-dependent methyltransferase [Patescibacteria group bacterium]|nr:class I SAM-dependent methyltransferase [Patescibacteria group bacterium]MBU1922014.1 class I SAM-dependent methyltransferase [Patescibacteria group bacterium]